jgi:UDP-2,3-diacylglucosamine pyrophosphatase LpxH
MMIIVVSDIHLGYNKCNKDLFEEFIDSKLTKLHKTDHLILLGDLFDFWRRQGADIQSKVQDLERLNQSMRIRDKMKDDAIAHLSGQLIALTARLDQSKDDGNRSLRVLNRRYRF